MNNLKNYFSSPEKSPPAFVTTLKNQGSIGAVESTEVFSKICNNSCSPTNVPSATSPFPYVVKTPRADSKLILQNMEEVLNSVKRKHKHKHRRKREQKKRAQMQTTESDERPRSIEVSSPAAPNGRRKGENNRKNNVDKLPTPSKKIPLHESTGQRTDQHIKSASTVLPTRRKTLPCKQTERKFNPPILEDSNSVSQISKQENSNKQHAPNTEKLVKTNAFEFMMNARNRTIGSNTPGKDANEDEESKTTDATVKDKRRVFLQEWAEKKGSNKRKLDDEARQVYIEKKLDRRAKRLKKLLTNGTSVNSTPLIFNLTPSPVVNTAKDKIKPKTSTHVTKGKRSGGSSKRIDMIDYSLSAEDSINSQDSINNKISDDFLSKLSSPIKRKDSLFGYFARKDEKKDSSIIMSGNHTPKHKKRTNEKITTPISDDNEQRSKSKISCTRPKRSCSSKLRYDYDLSESPKKVKSKYIPSKSGRANEDRTTHSGTLLIDCDVISSDDLDNSTSSIKKLAPLFIRTMPKPNPNPEVMEARKQFLLSGVPEKMRIEKEKQKQFEQVFDKLFEWFPKVNHVSQISEDEAKYFCTSFKMPGNCFRNTQDSSPTLQLSTPVRRQKSKNNRLFLGSITTCTTKDFRTNSNIRSDCGKLRCTFSASTSLLLPQIDNKRRIIKKWKSFFDRFPTYKCYNQMREKYRFFCAVNSGQNVEQVTESLVVTRKTHRVAEITKLDPEAEEDKPPLSAPNGELLFTEKYKPLMSAQVLVNLTPVNQLRDFLSNWHANGNNGQRIMSANDLVQDFWLTNDSISANSIASTSVVLLGPGSSGKTNAVFALANEMNFNVLEVNAGMKRTGKKLLQELQEATQSHQIRKETAKSTLKLSLNGKRSNKDTGSSPISNDSGPSPNDLSQPVRKSLILIEDADIIFDQHDAGFVDALYTLAVTSKRPVIIVASNSSCQHLQRLYQQNQIKFSPANPLNISKFLSVLSLIENCPIELNDLLSLYLFNRQDLRKTILEIQFYIQSGGDRRKVLAKSKDFAAQQPVQFFASSTKRYVEESKTLINGNSTTDQHDDESTKNFRRKNSEDDDIYVHRGLFEFYTVSQNFFYRIPFPIDFSLLRENLNVILRSAKNLKLEQSSNTMSRRKSRSPKKAWINAANQPQPLQSLCSFYDNISIAAMLSPNESDLTPIDRLSPRLSDEISQSIVERAININLESGYSPYNLFKSPKENFKLSSNQSVIALRTQSAINLDYEPILRSICRNEKNRFSSERRGSRFYHYLRNFSTSQISFSPDYYDKFCSILSEEKTEI